MLPSTLGVPNNGTRTYSIPAHELFYRRHVVPDELEPLHDRVFDWMNVEDDSDGTYAVLIPQPFEDAWFGDVGGKTPKAVRPALPTTPNIRVSRP